MIVNDYDIFFAILRLGIGHSDGTYFKFKVPRTINWMALKAFADVQGLTAVVLDGLNMVHDSGFMVHDSMPQMLRLEWIGEVLQNYEARYKQYEKSISSLAGWYNQHGYKMMVLKGYACSQDWPKPEHRPCGDIDIWLFGQQKEADALLESLEFSNESSESVQGVQKFNKFKVDRSHHHHTVFEWQGFTVESHYDFINVHSRSSNKKLEGVFKELGKDDSRYDNEIGIFLPSPNLHALFLIRHLAAHFTSVSITLRQILDWAFYVEKHTEEIDWDWLVDMLKQYHMYEFYNIINAICVGNLGFDVNMFPSVQFDPALKDRVLNDIFKPEYMAEEPRNFVKRLLYKYKRGQGNKWKQELCFKESMWSAFWSGVWSHLLKPKSI